MKQFEQAKLEVAIKYVKRIADGCNPVNNVPLENDDVLNQIYEPIADMNVKKVSVTKVTAALKEEGYLLDEPNPETGKTRKVPSAKGQELGIYTIKREYNGRMYESVTYNQNAQRYVVELIEKLAEE